MVSASLSPTRCNFVWPTYDRNVGVIPAELCRHASGTTLNPMEKSPSFFSTSTTVVDLPRMSALCLHRDV
jgi:hypothetical protein